MSGHNVRIHPHNENLESLRPRHLSFKQLCNVLRGGGGVVGRGIGGVLGLALGGVCAAQAPLGPHLLFKMKALF